MATERPKTCLRLGLAATVLLGLLPSMMLAQSSDSTQARRSKFLPVRYVQSILYDSSGFNKGTNLVYPILLYAPETSLEVGLSFNYLFTIGGDTTTTRYSNVVPLVFYTLRGQYGLWLTNEVFTPDERWLILGLFRFQNFPLSYYGVGPEARESDGITLEQTQLWLKQRVLHKVRGNWFAGLELEYKKIFNVRADGLSEECPPGVSENTAVGFGPALTYEGRHNPLNPEAGSSYMAASWMWFEPWMGSNRYFSNLSMDVRHYLGLGRRNTLAMQQYLVHQTGTPPFNLYAQMGGDMMLRGWYYGRFRDRNLWGQQLEYRRANLFGRNSRWGATVFAAMGGVAPQLDEFQSLQLQTSAGAGVRFKLFTGKNINLRFDYAITREGSNFYVALGEAF